MGVQDMTATNQHPNAGSDASWTVRAGEYMAAARRTAHRLSQWPLIQTLWAFYAKLNSDWIFALSGLLAYNLLMSIFPILLVLIAVAGFTLGALSPGIREALIAGIVAQLPPGVGQPIVDAVLASLSQSAGIVLIFGVLSAAFFGSRLFVVVEDCFGIIFQLPSRRPVQRNLMALGMMALYLVLLPLIFLNATIASALARLFLHDRARAVGLQTSLISVLVTLLLSALLFGAIYVVVPNRPVRWREVWKGTVVSAVLLVVYQQVFPLYQAYFLTPTNPGSLIGLVLVILVFFYYLAFILLLGAEVNAWAAGERARRQGVATLLRDRPAP
jgi:YihY family inner membrane protein